MRGGLRHWNRECLRACSGLYQAEINYFAGPLQEVLRETTSTPSKGSCQPTTFDLQHLSTVHHAGISSHGRPEASQQPVSSLQPSCQCPATYRSCFSTLAATSEGVVQAKVPDPWAVGDSRERKRSRVECDAGYPSPVIFEAQVLAPQADGSCLLRCGDTQLLATAVCQSKAEERKFLHLDREMLRVEYRERMYAVGKIPGGYTKREGGPSEHESAVASAVTRALRPFFPKHLAEPVELCVTVLSSDGETDTVALAITAASAALAVSPVPWATPVAAVRVAGSRGTPLCPSPSAQALALADISLLLAGSRGGISMMDAQGAHMTGGEIREGTVLGINYIERLVAAQAELAAEFGAEKAAGSSTSEADPAAAANVDQMARPLVEEILRDRSLSPKQREQSLEEARLKVLERLRAKGFFRLPHMRVAGSGCVTARDLALAFDDTVAAVLRKLVFQDNLRSDGRGLRDIRPLLCQVGELPGAHGSALVEAGAGQALAAVTVGNRFEMQEVESLLGVEQQRLFVHTAQPAFAQNQVTPFRWPKWGEAGHARRLQSALEGSLRDPVEFAMRVNADLLAVDGSAEALALGAALLALQNAGAPLNHLVAGANVGIMKETKGEGEGEGRWEVLADVTHLEEAAADAEIVAATSSPTSSSTPTFSSLHLDTSFPGGLELEVVEEGVRRCGEACQRVMACIEAAAARNAAVVLARFGEVGLRRQLLGRLIGPGGSNIKALERSTGAKLVVKDEGAVLYYASTPAQAAAVEAALDSFTGFSIQEGSRHVVKVASIADYGAFVEFSNGIEALLHISELSHVKVRSVEDAVSLGMTFEVLVLPRDMKGQLRVSRKALLPKPSPSPLVRALPAASSGHGEAGPPGDHSSSSPDAPSRPPSPEGARTRTPGDCEAGETRMAVGSSGGSPISSGPQRPRPAGEGHPAREGPGPQRPRPAEEGHPARERPRPVGRRSHAGQLGRHSSDLG